MNTKCLKLTSGMDIIGRVVSESDSGIFVLSKVMQVMAHPTPQGIAVSLIPFILFCEQHDTSVESVEFNPNTYLLSYTPKSDLISAYIEQTAGIALVRNGAPTPMKA